MPLMSGAPFVFINHTGKRLETGVYWDNTGLAIWSKRLNKRLCFLILDFA